MQPELALATTSSRPGPPPGFDGCMSSEGAVCLPQGYPGTKAASSRQGNGCPFVPRVPFTHYNMTQSQSRLRGFPESSCHSLCFLTVRTSPFQIVNASSSCYQWRIRTIIWIALDIGLIDHSQNVSPPHLPSSPVCEERGCLPQDQGFYGSYFGVIFIFAIVAVHSFPRGRSHISRHFLS